MTVNLILYTSFQYSGITCSDYNGIPMTSSDPKGDPNGLVSPAVCCGNSCGDKCNDCYGNKALQPHTCSGNMCSLGTGGDEQCCATSIPEDKICGVGIDAPCRLGK